VTLAAPVRSALNELVPEILLELAFRRGRASTEVELRGADALASCMAEESVLIAAFGDVLGRTYGVEPAVVTSGFPSSLLDGLGDLPTEETELREYLEDRWEGLLAVFAGSREDPNGGTG
jgi:hypothetical protein